MGIAEETKKRMAVAIEHFKNELKGIRTGRANPGMVEHLHVELYGTAMRLKDIASISVPDARTILITPFDVQNLNTIVKEIEKSNLGFKPGADGHAIRLSIPPMTDDVRKRMAKMCHEELEKAKISIRNIRREGIEENRKEKGAEDESKKAEKNIQELTDKFCKEAEELCSKKEKEISTI